MKNYGDLGITKIKTNNKTKQNKQNLILTEYANQSHNFINLIFVTSSLLFSIVQNGGKKLSWTGCLPFFLRLISYVSENKKTVTVTNQLLKLF